MHWCPVALRLLTVKLRDASVTATDRRASDETRRRPAPEQAGKYSRTVRLRIGVCIVRSWSSSLLVPSEGSRRASAAAPCAASPHRRQEPVPPLGCGRLDVRRRRLSSSRAVAGEHLPAGAASSLLIPCRRAAAPWHRRHVFTASPPLERTAPPPPCLCPVAAWLRCPCRAALLL
ncbi:hypothetical protein E2562_013081 [Oryza meyeriana var. granulata]|uniref:Uncharacterized protein n=1 Tax=Oryza meyeriana var. granulata TaxID=110450 RepID=A0A6G1DIH3_9ORYZ|nr:hypothetical protein E2562_013081 [Oryza meyeriana var. granulata]